MPDRSISFGQLETHSRALAKQLLAAGVGKGTRGRHPPAHRTRVGGGLRSCQPHRSRSHAIQHALPINRAPDRDAHRGRCRADIGTCDAWQRSRELPGGGSARVAWRFGRAFALPAVPYLRSVILLGESDRSWAGLAQPASHDFFVFDDELFEAIEAEVTPADWLLVMFTSGTTAAPKAIVHSHGAALLKTSPAAGSALHAIFPGRVLNLMPFFWIGGMQELLSSMQSGATLLTLERLDAASALELGRRERATSVMGNSKTMGPSSARRTSKR